MDRKNGSKLCQIFFASWSLLQKGILQTSPTVLGLRKGKHLLQEIHSGSCGTHSRARNLVRKTIRAGFYWAKTEVEAKK